MKTNISLKYTVAKVVIGMAAFLPLFSFTASAQADVVNANTNIVATTDQTSSGGLPQISTFCASVDSSTSTIDSLITKKEADYASGKAALTGALAASRVATDKELYNQRVAANADYAAQFKTLSASATTPDQQAAVVLFKKTVLQAIATRRANVDVAIQNYRAGVDAILASRDAAYTAALATLKTSADASLAAGSASCATDPSSMPASTPAATIAGAQATFQTAISNIGDSSTNLAALATTRDAKITAAGTKFSTTVDTAAATLKTVLGQ